MNEPSYKVWADIPLNRLYIVLEGFMPLDMLKAAADKVIAEGDKLKPGFHVINDISRMATTSPEGADHIKRAQAHLKEIGVARVIRILLQENTVTKMQFDRTSKEFYQANVASSLEEAEDILNHSE
jgi:cell division ATPase FtsA